MPSQQNRLVIRSLANSYGNIYTVRPSVCVCVCVRARVRVHVQVKLDCYQNKVIRTCSKLTNKSDDKSLKFLAFTAWCMVSCHLPSSHFKLYYMH